MFTDNPAATEPPIRVLVVEDNLVVQQYLLAALRQHPHCQVIGVVGDGLQAVEMAGQARPDIILLDLFLPGLDGLGVIQRVMNQSPCPIVVISGELDQRDRDLDFEAQRAGAVAVMAKPQGMEDADFQRFSRELGRMVQVMSRVKVVRRWAEHKPAGNVPEPPPLPMQLNVDLLVIGASTGGPAALYRLLEGIGPALPYPVLVAQHIAPGFVDTLAAWLGKTGCRVKVAEPGESLQAGQVYLAPDGQHLVLDAGACLQVVHDPAARFTPSVDHLFASVADNYRGRVCALVLTGMGDDGTAGMARLYQRGAMTIAQSQASCVIFGMPKMVINAGLARAVLDLDEMCQVLRAG